MYGHIFITLLRSRLTLLKSMEDKLSEIRKSQLLYTGAVDMHEYKMGLVLLLTGIRIAAFKQKKIHAKSVSFQFLILFDD